MSLGAPKPAPEDPEYSPRARRRDTVRYATAGGVGTTAIAVGFLLNGVSDLREDFARLADGLNTMQATVERLQSATATAAAADRLTHNAIDARLTGLDQQCAVFSRDLEGQQRGLGDLGQRVTRLEGQRAESAAMRAPDPVGRLMQLARAVRALPPDSPGSWTADTPPKPTVSALAAVLGTPVSAQERDAAWQLAGPTPDLAGQR